jgi:regulation of enolase protein 1 (concanavalin A-like superfamily)
MQWYNEPRLWEQSDNRVTVTTDPKTDFWRKTHYGFIRDNGHLFYQQVNGDFQADVRFSGAYNALYDQAGLMVRIDEAHWVKCGVEFVNGVQHASAVVTRDYSDWSVLPLPGNPPEFWLRVTRHDAVIEVFYSLDGSDYTMIRTAHLSAVDTADIGLMCASPEGGGFRVTFEGFTVRSH